jgi:hypothetical protein
LPHIVVVVGRFIYFYNIYEIYIDLDWGSVNHFIYMYIHDEKKHGEYFYFRTKKSFCLCMKNENTFFGPFSHTRRRSVCWWTFSAHTIRR